MRRFLTPLIAFLAPFVVYALYRMVRSRAPEARRWPLAILFIAGAVLSAQAFAIAALSEPRIDRRPPPQTEIAP